MDNQVKRFYRTFTIGGNELTLEFHPMHVREKKLYQVYYQEAGKHRRFHMHRNGNGSFVIADRDKVPASFLKIENDFAEVINNS